MANWFHLGPVLIATFFASLVEFVEALTIVLAVGTTRNWRSALWGTAFAILALTLLLVVGGPLIQHIPIRWMQLFIGALVLVFGLRWLKKATLRSAGRIPMHDEDAEFARETAAMGGGRLRSRKLDTVAFLTCFKAVFLEGFEVAFIVLTAGSISSQFWPAVFGAASALVLVLALGLILHKPLSRVPENALKRTVGIALSSFGLFWLGEGLGFEWPMGDGALFILAAAFTALSFVASRALRVSHSSSTKF